MSLKVYLIRHGETDFNKDSLEWGQDDQIPLNDLGIIQSKKLAKRLKDIHFKKLFCSNLKRAIQTAEEIRKLSNAEIVIDKRLKEYEPGGVDPSSEKWMEKYKEILELGMSKYEIRPFGGENIWDLIKRVNSFLEDIQKEEGTIGIISHSGVNSVFINLSQKREKSDFLKFKQDNVCINILAFSKGKWKIKTINDSNHINDTIPKKRIYANQKEVREIAKEYIVGKLGDISNKIYIGGDIITKEFGVYERSYKRYNGSIVKVYAQLKDDFKIPREWKVSLLLEGVEKYEIGSIQVENIKHKVNLNLIKDNEDVGEMLERVGFS